ncbi:head maturation protease, ClpP-related [Peptoniphilus duerdenii]|uniref:head maturation protease, ClpP-related n=1 Tax=Peptoniphilus duerdenii TaxID=507750 RepID=UPI0023F3B360|nr:head maturation protease, ClpP-related [Peptoniphilus duerdenii]
MTIKINGAIVGNDDKWIYDWCEIEAFCPRDLNLVEGQDVDIEINSPGGYIYPASEIYTALMQHRGNVNITITGRAASAASVIAMAGTHVKMSPTAQMMIHNVSASGAGDYRDFEHYAEQLRKSNDTIANAYMLKTGKTRDEILKLMDHETWFTPEEALEEGFIDEVLSRNDSQDQFRLVAASDFLIPQAVIDKLKQEREQEQLNLLKLKEK